MEVLEKIQVHYNVGHLAAPEGDTKSPDGKYVVALNKWAIDRFQPVGPLHPQNFQLELDSMLEVARKYPVDGLHFDYIRYPDVLPFVPGARFGVGLEFGFGEASLEECACVHARSGVTLEVHVITRGVIGLAAEEVVEADLVERRR